MDTDLAEKLSRRIRRIESVESSSETSSTNGNVTIDDIDLSTYEYQRPFELNPLTKCNELSRKQLRNLMETFDKYDTDKDKTLDFNELKIMMEKLGIPQTHLSLKQMIKQVDKDHDGKISFQEFLNIFQKAILENDQGYDRSSFLYQLYGMLFEIDVSKEGVNGAKLFFEAKISAVKESDKFQREIREEQEQRRLLEEEKLRRKLAFQNRLAQFQAT